MSKTSIEWTDESVNPIRARNIETGAVGHYCERPSTGCKNCYASKWNERVRPSGKHLIGTGLAFDVRNRDKVEMFIDEPKLQEVLRRRKPTKWFWCDMTDMFGEWVPDGWLDLVFAVMAMTPQHTHQVLTKRPERMQQYCLKFARPWKLRGVRGENIVGLAPLSNVWLGCSVENQPMADLRIPQLLQTPAAIRFISAEPLLGPVDLTELMVRSGGGVTLDALNNGPGLDWVIVGGESGPWARPMHPDWPRLIRNQCVSSGVKFFFKQWGEWQEGSRVPGWSGEIVLNNGHHARFADDFSADDRGYWSQRHAEMMAKVGKKAAGRELDGRTWDEFPAVRQ